MQVEHERERLVGQDLVTARDGGSRARHLVVAHGAAPFRRPVLGRLSDEGRDDLVLRWFNSLPESHARAVLAGTPDAERLLGSRPLTAAAAVSSLLWPA